MLNEPIRPIVGDELPMYTLEKVADMASIVRTVGDQTRCSGDAMRSRRDAETDVRSIEVVGDDGTVTTLLQRADGTIEIHSAAMSSAGRAVRVSPTGSAVAYATDSGRPTLRG